MHENMKYMPLLITGMILIMSSSCTRENETQIQREQEQRFFNIYRARNYPDAQIRSSGLHYAEHREGQGASPDRDDWVLVNHVSYTIPEDNVFESYVEEVALDNQFFDSAALYGPYKMQNGTRNEGLTEGLTLMKEGGQYTFLFTSELGYGTSGSGDINPYTSLKYEVELLEVITDINAYEQAKVDAYVDTIPDADTVLETGLNIPMYYIIDRPGDGDFIVDDSVVEIAYKGYLVDGRVFDQATVEDPFEFSFGEEDLILGWDLGLPRLREGDKARFVIPYQLGYGVEEQIDPGTGFRTIPPYETLLFDIEVLAVKSEPGGVKEK